MHPYISEAIAAQRAADAIRAAYASRRGQDSHHDLAASTPSPDRGLGMQVTGRVSTSACKEPQTC
jgi:hypothetical protein